MQASSRSCRHHHLMIKNRTETFFLSLIATHDIHYGIATLECKPTRNSAIIKEVDFNYLVTITMNLKDLGCL